MALTTPSSGPSSGQTSGGFSSWWGRHATVADRTDFWQIGPLKMWLQSSAYRMHLRWVNGGHFLDGHVRSVPGSKDAQGAPIEIPATVSSLTCAFGSTNHGEVVLSPALPDRTIVVRLSEAMSVLPGEDVTFYMIVPLWLRLELSENSKLLTEIPTFRLSDTWFGPMSNLGSLCYANASELYLDLRSVPLRPHCVITAITIRNLGIDALKLERLNIPFPRLSLFYSQRSGFWTDRLTLERRDDNEMAKLKLDRQPPAEAAPTQFVTGPRETGADTNSVVRAFSAIFREKGQS
jgi:hypothetical protein